MESNTLSKHPTASFRELLGLSIPLVLSFVSSYLIFLADRFFLSRYTLSAFEACATASSLYFFFQMISLRFVSTVQAFVGEAKGGKRYREASSYTWQMLWFSFLSPLVVIPVGLIVGKAFFKGAPIENEAMIYFTYMICGNFLFSIEGTLSGFFSGIGQTKRVFKTQLISQLANIILSPILIFGVFEIIPSMGIHGAAIGTLAAKALSCSVLFLSFLYHKSLTSYKTRSPNISIEKLTACLSAALPRAIGQGVAVLSWNLAARILIQKGGIDLLVSSFGSTIHLALLNDGLGLAFLTVSSYLIGSKQWHLFPKLFRSTAILIAINASILSLPFFFFRDSIINTLYPHTTSLLEKTALKTTCVFVWLSLVNNSIYLISFMLLTALKDLWFYMLIHTLYNPLIIPITFYLSQQKEWNPTTFWVLVSLQPLPLIVIYFSRAILRIKQPYKNAVRSSPHLLTNNE